MVMEAIQVVEEPHGSCLPAYRLAVVVCSGIGKGCKRWRLYVIGIGSLFLPGAGGLTQVSTAFRSCKFQAFQGGYLAQI